MESSPLQPTPAHDTESSNQAVVHGPSTDEVRGHASAEIVSVEVVDCGSSNEAVELQPCVMVVSSQVVVQDCVVRDALAG